MLFRRALMIGVMIVCSSFYLSQAKAVAVEIEAKDSHCECLFPEKEYFVNRPIHNFQHTELRWLVSWVDENYNGCEIDSLTLRVRSDSRNAEIELFDGFTFTGFPARVRDHWHSVRFDLFHAHQPLFQENIALRARGTVEIRSIRFLLK